MHFTTIFVFAATALAAPLLEERQLPVCSGAAQAQCCATDVLNLVDLNCATRMPRSPTSHSVLC